MQIFEIHSWPDKIDSARKLQEKIKNNIIIQPLSAVPQSIAAADVAYDYHSNHFFACTLLFDYKTSEILEKHCCTGRVEFPYVPGYLSFRELPPVLECFKQLTVRPDLVIVDGHGYAHPKNFGLACHLGLWLNLPTFGIAKKKLVGEYKEPLDEKGNYAYLNYHDEIVGAVLRTKHLTKPVFISVGHLIDLRSALNITENLLDGYRIPYPTRVVDRIVAHYKKEQIGNHGGEIQKPAK